MPNGMLDKGVESQGATHRSYDKYGKRMWVATPKKDMSKKDKKMSPNRGAVGNAVPGDVKRVDVGI